MKTQLSLVKSILIASGAVAIASMNAQSASAFTFSNIPASNTGETYGDKYVNNFSFDVTSAGTNSVLFKIFNNGGNGALTSMFIGGVYFNQGATGLLSNMTINSANTSASGVSFGVDRRAANFAQGNKINFESAFSATKSGAAANGVGAGEFLGITFTGNYNSVVSALNSGSLQLGLHVQGIDAGGYSDSFASATPGGPSGEVPEPATMLGSALALGFFAKMKKRANNA